MSDLYDRDIVLWSEQQAEHLRRYAAGERVNSADLDWPNIVEEIESVGNSELRAVESLLLQALAHALKIQAWPGARDVDHWRMEARLFREQARRRFVPSMRQRIDAADLYASARRVLLRRMDGQPSLPVPETCPDMLDQLLGGGPCGMFPEEGDDPPA